MLDALFRRRLPASAAPASLKRVIAWSGPGRAHWSPRDIAGYAREGYGANPVAYRCVRLIAEAAASAPLAVSPPGHPLARLLNNPNTEQTGTELREALFGHLQVAGNGFLEAVAGADGAPAELHALRPERIAVIAGASGPAGYEYRIDSAPRRLMRDPLTEESPVLHLKLFHPADDFWGQSPMQAAAGAIDIHNAGAAWNKALIDNAARPSGALVFAVDGERLSDAQFDRLKAELDAAHAGPANAGRPMLLEGGLDWKPMSLSPADMDFAEARHAAAREIALAFGVPPMLLGIPGDNTYATYKEANLAFWRLTALPLALKTARALERWLAQRWPGAGAAEVGVDLDAVPALSAEREALWARIEQAGFLDTAEKRRLAGLAPQTVLSPQTGKGAP